MADKWLTFDCYGTIADWNTGMGKPLEAIVGREAGRLLGAYHRAELELEAGPGWMPYREVLISGLAWAAEREGITLNTSFISSGDISDPSVGAAGRCRAPFRRPSPC